MAKIFGVDRSGPIGAIIDSGGVLLPGTIYGYGQAVSRTTYKALFDFYGTTYGPGDGSTTFNVPDLRGRATAGKDDMGGTPAGRLGGIIAGTTLGAVAGEEQHTLSVGEMPSHDHGYNDPGHNHALHYDSSVTTSTGAGGYSLVSPGQTLRDDGSIASRHTGISFSAEGGSAGHNNLQPSIITNKVICYQ